MPKLALTPAEAELLEWEPGDWYEIVPGSITFSARRDITVNGRSCVQHKFFFESQEPSWGTKEWDIVMDANIPNGPGLLVLLRRGNSANVFGLVSLVNRAWTHTVPLSYCPMIEKSSKFKQLERSITTNAVKTIAAGTAISLVPIIGRSLGKKFVHAKNEAIKEQTPDYDGVCRALMFKISQNADQYWQGGGGGESTSGRL